MELRFALLVQSIWGLFVLLSKNSRLLEPKLSFILNHLSFHMLIMKTQQRSGKVLNRSIVPVGLLLVSLLIASSYICRNTKTKLWMLGSQMSRTMHFILNHLELLLLIKMLLLHLPLDYQNHFWHSLLPSTIFQLINLPFQMSSLVFWMMIKSRRSHPHNGCDSVWPNATAKLCSKLISEQRTCASPNTEPQDQKLKDWMVVEHQEGVI